MKKILALLLAVMMLLALCACGDKEETPAPAVDAAAPAVDAAAAAVEGAASGEPAVAAAEGEGSPEAKLDSSGTLEVTIDGVTGELAYQETDNGDEATKSIVLTWQGVEYTGKIDKGNYTADDPAAQPLFDAYKVVFEAQNPMGPASGEASAEPAA